MAVVLLGANNTGDTSQTAINTAPNTTSSGNLFITASGTVLYVKLKMSQNSAIQSNGGHSFEFFNNVNEVIATGTFDALGTVPKGDPAAWYTINLTGSPLVVIDDRVYLNAQKDSGGGIVLQWRKDSIYMLEVWGEETVAPGKATNPTPTDDQEDTAIAGSLRITTLTWNAPTDETPDYLVYFRASGGAWVLQETITDDSTSHTLSSDILDSLAYYSIYEWRVDTYDGVTELTTTGDTWTFISQVSPQYTDYTRRSDYDADKVWQPGTGWVDINTFAYTGGGRFKGRVLVVGHKVLYFGDL